MVIFVLEPMRNMRELCALCIDAYNEQMWEFFSLSAELLRAHTRKHATPHSPIDSRRGLTASKTNLRSDDEAADVDDGDS